jgi:hypothetical protein
LVGAISVLGFEYALNGYRRTVAAGRDVLRAANHGAAAQPATE